VKLTETIEDLARSVTARPDPVLHASITLPQPAAAGPPSSTTTTVPGVPGLPGSHPYVPPTPPPPPSYVPGQPNPRPAPSPTRASREEADQASSGRAPTPVQITIQAVDAQSFREWVSRNRDARRTIAEVAFAGLTGKNA
jgi:hypothetical protein